MPAAETCATHPEALAGWSCVACGPRCPACVAERAAGFSTLAVCATCGGLAHPIVARRAVLVPFVPALPAALVWPLRGHGVALLLGWGLLLTLLGYINAAIFARGLLLAYLFHVTRTSALGHEDYPGAADFRGLFEDILGPLCRLVLATVWVTAPLIILSWGLRGPAPWPIIALVCLLGFALVPISMLASAIGTPFSTVVNPLALGAYALKLGRDYLWLVGFSAATGGLYVGWLAFADHYLADTFIVRVLVSAAALIVPFAFFRALGLLLRARGDDLGWGRREDYLVNVLGEVRPRAGHHENVAGRSLGAASSEAAAEDRPTAVAAGHHLDDEAGRDRVGDYEVKPFEASTAAPARPPPEPIELPPDEPAAAPADTLELIQAVREGRQDAALDQLERWPKTPALTLSADAWVQLGKAGLQAKRFRPALVAFRRAIEVAPEGQAAPQAWLLAARVYDEGLKDRRQSDRLLAELVRRFPESQEGRFAAKRLGAA